MDEITTCGASFELTITRELSKLPFAANRAIAPALPVGEESPDSTEQCTGE